MLLRASVGLLFVLVTSWLLQALLHDSVAIWWHKPTVENVGGKRVLVTGANRGIGRETALLYCRLGARVLLHGRNQEALKEVTSACASAGGLTPTWFLADMSKPGEAARAVAAAVGDEDLDVLIVNHVSRYVFETHDSFVRRLAAGDIQRQLQTDLFSYVETVNAALPRLTPSGGSVVIVSSMAAQLPLGYCYGYCFAKSALGAYATALRQELAINGSNVHVGTAHLTLTDTSTARDVIPGIFALSVPFASAVEAADGIASVAVGRQRALTVPGSQHVWMLLGRLMPESLERRIRSVLRRL